MAKRKRTATSTIDDDDSTNKKAKTTTDQATVEIATTEEEQPPQEPQTKRYRLRSGRTVIEQSSDDGAEKENGIGEKAPSSKPKSGPKPFIKYTGAVEYYTEAADIEAACAKLLKWVQSEAAKDDCETIPIAFDMEWPFTFQTGSGRTAVIQLCADVGLCYVLHVSKLTELPGALLDLLYHEKVCLHGVCVKNDLRKLQRDYPVVDSQRLVDQCRDLGVWNNAVCNTGGRWSMERLVMYLCKLQINKEGKVRRSKWDVQPLTPEQQIYAAIDVYISQVMYLELRRREQKNAADDAAIVAEHGEKALLAIKQLQ